jgi:hypothetical protein
MQIRQYHEADLDSLRQIHAAQGFAYPLPDLRNPLFVTKLVLTESDFAAPEKNAAAEQPPTKIETSPRQEKIRAAAFLRLTAEAYLLLDPAIATPHEKMRAILALHAATEREAWQRGLEDVHAWLPPSIAKKFARRLTPLGWQRDDLWTPFCKKLSPP